MKKLFIVLVSCCAFLIGNAQRQDWLPDGSYGKAFNRIDPGNVMLLPTGCGAPAALASKDSARNKAAVYFDSCNNRFYVYNPKTVTWSYNTGGGGTGGGISKFIAGYGLVQINDSTARVDSSKFASRYAIDSLGNLKLNTADVKYQTIQNAGVSQTQRNKLNFGSEFLTSDNSGNSSSDISINVIGQSKVTNLSDSLDTKLPKRDSSTKYVTPTRLKDSLSSVRAKILLDSLASARAKTGIGNYFDSTANLADPQYGGGEHSVLRLIGAINSGKHIWNPFGYWIDFSNDSTVQLNNYQNIAGPGEFRLHSIGTLSYAGMNNAIKSGKYNDITGVTFVGSGTTTFNIDDYYTLQNAIQITDSAVQIHNCKFIGISGSAILGMYYAGSFYDMNNSQVYGNIFLGCTVGYYAYAGGNYATVSTNVFQECYRAIVAQTANCVFANNKMVYGTYGFSFRGGFGDRSQVIGNAINHNTHAIDAENTGYGYSFANNTVFYGDIYFKDCDKTTWANGIIATNSTITVDGSGITPKVVQFTNFSTSLTNTWVEAGTGKIQRVGQMNDNDTLYRLQTAIGVDSNKLPIATNVKWAIKMNSNNQLVRDSTGGGAGGGGISSLNGLSGSSQTFAKVDDTNVTLSIGSTSTTHTWTLGWTGTLADGRIASASNWNTAYGWGNHASAGYLTASNTNTLSNKNFTGSGNTFPTFNQNTSGSAATLGTPRSIYGNNFDGSAALAQIITSTYGGTGNGFTKFTGPATSEKTFTLPNASATVLTDNAAVTVAQGGTGLATLTAHNMLIGNGTSNVTSLAPSTSGKIPVSNGTDFVMSTPTFPNASATTGKMIKSDGTNWVASTETYAAPGTSGNVLTSDGTNWTSAAPVVTASSTNTFTNKRWTARVGNTTSSGTPTINTDNVDVYKLTAQAAAITSFTTNLSGTPVDGDVLEIQITDNGTARAITWGASFVSSSVTLPTTTTISTTLTVVFQYYTTSSYGNNKWACASYY